MALLRSAAAAAAAIRNAAKVLVAFEAPSPKLPLRAVQLPMTSAGFTCCKRTQRSRVHPCR